MGCRSNHAPATFVGFSWQPTVGCPVPQCRLFAVDRHRRRRHHVCRRRHTRLYRRKAIGPRSPAPPPTVLASPAGTAPAGRVARFAERKMSLRVESAATECDPLDCGIFSIRTLDPDRPRPPRHRYQGRSGRFDRLAGAEIVAVVALVEPDFIRAGDAVEWAVLWSSH